MFSAPLNQSLSLCPALGTPWLDKTLSPCSNPLLASRWVDKLELQWHQASTNTFKIRIFVSAESCSYNMILQEKHTESMTRHAPCLAETPHRTGNGSSKKMRQNEKLEWKKKYACLETNTVSDNRKRSLSMYSQKYFL